MENLGYPSIKSIYKHLHQHPEISWQENNTTDYIERLLEKTSFRLQRFVDCPGLVAELGQGKPCVALSADMDALWQEVDGEFRANHSCGHDAHMSIVLHALFALEEKQAEWKGTLRVIFQPAEETIEGALAMVEKGIVDDVDYFFGLHLRPIQELRSGEFAPAIQHGAVQFLEGRIEGEDAHGARPHLNKNAIELGAEMVQLLNNIHMDPSVPHSAKMTSFHSGGKSTNIIPGRATFSIDVRAQTNEVMDDLVTKIKSASHALSNLHGISIEVDKKAQVPAAVISEEAADYLEQGILKVMGKGALKPAIQTTGGDDFHFYTIQKPELKASMLAVGCDLKPGLHHPHMTFDQSVMTDASRVLVETVLGVLGNR
ncbi:M20 peptidase aminoacylase family protein [Halobacillus aidingensis]|uniref:Amidohydrolase n=1 Tax=Halobacillus aidingensis TaxID=240303 RepID=A0A1H0H3C0_HALAD|nr:M20 peptidase aminoacylase family protein [Halobacillus aidingensis]SDO13615.1 amidohydrolase [Halobacillus aidingensis]